MPALITLVACLLAALVAAPLPARAASAGTPAFSDPAPENLSFQARDQELGIRAAFSIDGQLYAIGRQQTWIYRLEEGRLQPYFQYPQGTLDILQTYTVAVLDGKAYIIGGLKDDGCQVPVPSGDYYNCATDEVWVFDPQAKTLELSPAHLNAARDVAASGVVDGKIYLLGGWYPNAQGENEKTVEVFRDGAWHTVDYQGTFLAVRSPAYATAGGKIYIMGGCLEQCQETLVQVFDPASNTFSQATAMPLAGRHFSGQNAAVRQDRYIYLFGGATDFSNTIFDDLALYDTRADQWRTLDQHLTMPRKDVASATVGDQLWVFGGATCRSDGCTDQGGSGADYGNRSMETGTFSAP